VTRLGLDIRNGDSALNNAGGRGKLGRSWQSRWWKRAIYMVNVGGNDDHRFARATLDGLMPREGLEIMRMTGNTMLITGGGSGIGLALAKRYAARGNRVIISGRRIEALSAAKRGTPELETLQSDVSNEAGRMALAEEARSRFPALNVLVNNAGIQNRLPPLLQPQDWSAHISSLERRMSAIEARR